MKPIDKEELYENLSGFLKTKGIELKAGSYAQGIQKSCHLLTEAINLGHEGLGRARVQIDQKLERMRQVIHEKTAPRSATNPPAAKPAPPSAASSAPQAAARKSRPGRKAKPARRAH